MTNKVYYMTIKVLHTVITRKLWKGRRLLGSNYDSK